MKTPMQYRRLGECGLKVSQFGLGGWTTFGGSIKDLETAKEMIRAAYRAGINFFDIADIYSKGESEKLMGAVLKEFPRHELVISSKVFWPMSEDINDQGLSRKHIMESIDKSLQRIGTDYLDLYFCHRFDPQTPLLETIRAMDDLIHRGKILYWGTSEWSAEQLKEAHAICEKYGYYKPQVEQPQYNLIERNVFEKSVAPMAHKLGMGLVTWSPLASGMLTGKYDEGLSEGRLSKIDFLRDAFYNAKNVEKVKKLKGIADQLGASRAELALAWTAYHSSVSSVILGATSNQQLQQNLRALKINITESLDKEIKAIFS